MIDTGQSGDQQFLNLMDRLAENVLESSEAELFSEVAEEGEEGRIVSDRVRTLLLDQVKAYRQRNLLRAFEEYRSRSSFILNRSYPLPESSEQRRELLASVFRRFPQMESAFLTVQHRDFKALSDSDVESFLKQLQELDFLKKSDLGDA